MNLVSSSDKSLMKFPTGHVGLVASSFSQKMVLPKIAKWIIDALIIYLGTDDGVIFLFS